MNKLKTKNIILSILLIFVLFCKIQTAFGINKTPIKILRIYDGDTILGEINGNKFNIRLVGIDCYESFKNNRAYKQAVLSNISVDEVVARGKKSTLYLTDLSLKNNNSVYIDFMGLDKYNRVLGVLYFGDINVNEKLKTDGGCMVYNYKE